MGISKTLILIILAILITKKLIDFRIRNDSNKKACSLLLELYEKKVFSKISGKIVYKNNQYLLRNPSIEFLDKSIPLSGNVTIDTKIIKSPNFEQGVWIKGLFKCKTNYKNPSQKSDLKKFFEYPTIHISHLISSGQSNNSIDIYTKISNYIRSYIEKTFKEYTFLLGFILAVWTGDSGKLSHNIKNTYIDLGISHVLALSGQHINAFSFCFSSVLFLIVLISKGKFVKIAAKISKILPLIGALLLFITSGGQPSIKRTLAMVIIQKIVILAGLYSKPFQIVCSSVALLIINEPELISNVGFILSAFACAFLVHISLSGNLKKMFYGYMVVSIIMPIVMIPLTAHLFGKIAYLSILANLLLSWFWDIVLIPVCFLVPVITIFLPKTVRLLFFNLIDKFCSYFYSLNEKLEAIAQSSYKTAISPSLYELFVITLIFFLLIKKFSGNLKRTNICFI